MSKVTGQPIKFSHAEALRIKATGFAADTAMVTTLGGTSPSAAAETRTFYNNLDCAFVFDKDSLLTMMAKIMSVPDSGLIMMMGASDDTTLPDPRINRPTLSVFACTIDKFADTYAVIHPNPLKPGDTDGIEHPGLVDLKASGGLIQNGPIKLINL